MVRTDLSLEQIQGMSQAWMENREVLLSTYRLYSGVSSVPSGKLTGHMVGALNFAPEHRQFWFCDVETGEVSEIHAVYAVETQTKRLFIEGWSGPPESHEWTKWIVEHD